MSLPERPPDPDVTAEQLLRIAASLERLERRFDEFAATYLDAKFPYGRPVDRWGRRRRGAA